MPSSPFLYTLVAECMPSVMEKLVSVPFSSLSMVVTVRCGHCTSLLSVNMKIASFLPLHLFGSLNQDDQPKIEGCPEKVDGPKALEKKGSSSDEDEEQDSVPVNQVINKPPEKRQRAPSAYNCFIKEEIRRLKAENPNITHKKAFSTAAKNWAHFPLSQQKGKGESCSQGERKMAKCSDVEEVHVEGNGISESKASWHSIFKDTP